MNYDPFVKEDFILPEKWCIKRNNSRINEWLNKNNSSGSTYESLRNDYAHIPSIKGYHLFEHIQNGYTEITFEQFKQYVLKESIEQSKSIEKWSVGSYVVFLIKYGGYSEGTIGTITFLQNNTVNVSLKYFSTSNDCCLRKDSECKWFATLQEAKEFAKTLVEPVKEEVKTPQLDLNEWLDKYKKLNLAVNDLANAIELANFDKVFLKLKGTNSKEKSNILYDLWNPKQPLKQAVHCKTQEEWDFVTNKLGYKWGQHCSFSAFSESTCISLIDTQYSYVDYLKNDYQILSFQEWCDLNGYKASHLDKIKSNDFKVGDYVVITKSSKNWTSEMDVEVGKVVQITDISDTSYINYKGKPCWSFGARDRHFRHATLVEINNHLLSIGQIPAEPICTNTNSSKHDGCGEKYGCIQNCNECDYYQIPAGEPLNTDIEPDKDGMFKYTTYAGTTHVGKTSTISGPLKMTLSIDDEELPMVSIIKTNSIKQLLNND